MGPHPSLAAAPIDAIRITDPSIRLLCRPRPPYRQRPLLRRDGSRSRPACEHRRWGHAPTPAPVTSGTRRKTSTRTAKLPIPHSTEPATTLHWQRLPACATRTSPSTATGATSLADASAWTPRTSSTSKQATGISTHLTAVLTNVTFQDLRDLAMAEEQPALAHIRAKFAHPIERRCGACFGVFDDEAVGGRWCPLFTRLSILDSGSAKLAIAMKSKSGVRIADIAQAMDAESVRSTPCVSLLAVPVDSLSNVRCRPHGRRMLRGCCAHLARGHVCPPCWIDIPRTGGLLDAHR